MKKLFAAVIALALVLSLCGMAMAEDPITITVAIADKTNIEDYNTNQMTLYIEEKLGIDLDMHVYDSTDYTSKINLMVASGDTLEDIIIVGPGDALLYQWAQDGAIIPLTEYYNNPELAVNIYEAMERVGFDFRTSMILPDGEIYGIPSLNQSYGNEHGEGRVWIYTPWLEQLGEEIPTTIEEYKALLEKAIATDLNGNGIADEVGLVGYNGIKGQWFNWLMDAFVTCNPNKQWMNVKDGQIYFAYTTDEWRQGVEFIKTMFDEGLIPTEALTQSFADYKTWVNSEAVTCMTFAYTNADGITDVERKGNYTVIAPITGPNGFSSTTYNPSVPSSQMVITADCQYPEIAFQVGDLLVSEELSIVTRFGEHGVEWDYVAEKEDPSQYACPYELFPPYVVIYHDSQYWGSGAMQNKSWMQTGPFIRQFGIAAGMAYNPDNLTQFDLEFANGCTVYQTSESNPKEYIAKLIYSAEEQEVVTAAQTDLDTLVVETTAAWLMGTQELNDETWAAFQAKVASMNAEGFLACAQAAYDRANG